MQKNVVVMAMSTLALGRRKEGEIPKIPAYRFGYPGGPEEGEEYYSQVEPSSKMILEKEGSLDKIIILATKESKNDETFQYKDEIRTMNAIDFYLERLEITDREKVKIIDLAEENLTPAISETINTIRSIWNESETNNKPKLWIDTQGGFRYISLVINAVISLLKTSGEERIEPRGIYSLNFTNGKPVKPIVDQTNTYQIFQFVSGINEFTRYGRAEQLMDYYESIHEEAPKEIVVMKNIAEAIQLCDMNAFDQFLKNLRKVVKDSDRSRQDFLSIFWEQIENDYGNLLKDSCTGIDIVEWFYEKKFYQQAITYIESKLPQEWVKRKLVTMNAEKVDMKAYKNRLGKKHEKDANVLIVEILFCCFKWSEIVKLQYNQKTKKQERKKVDEFKDPSHLKSGRNPMYKELFLDEYCTELKVKGQSYGEMTFSFNGKNKEKVVDLLLLYRLLKTERNKINHMSSTADRADQATLDRVLKMFVDVGRQAYQNRRRQQGL